MEKIKLDAHSSVMLIYPMKENGEIILGGYDGGYPRRLYASKPNLLGGNPEQDDKTNGPHDVLLREINEEINKEEKGTDWKGRLIKWANLEDIAFIRNSVIKNIKPYADFLVNCDILDGAYKAPLTLINSVFLSAIPEDAVECIRDNIKSGRSFCTEGFIGIHYLRQLEAAGEFSTAHATAPILNSFFGTNIPYPEQIKASKLEGNIRALYKDYDNDFEHTERVWGAK